MLIAQISDMHVVAPDGRLANGCDSPESLGRCVRAILRSDPLPDAVLATGDLTEHGDPLEYANLRRLLAPLPMPVYLIPGNHDERGALLDAFAGHEYLPRTGGPLCYQVNTHALRLIALDTQVAGEDGGALDAAQLDWLDTALSAEATRPTMIFMHHPPVATGFRCMDAIALDAISSRHLGGIVSRHRQIERIVCGHVHRSVQARWHGTLVSVCPSTAFQAVLDIGAGDFKRSVMEPPAYQLHFWNGAELVTHILTVQ